MNNLSKHKSPRILVVIPAYQNATTLEKVILETANLSMPILVVNDGSTDNTKEIVVNVSSKLLQSNPSCFFKHISHDANLGKGCALLTGFKFAEENDFDYIATIDADGQHYPQDLVKLVEPINGGHEGVVIGVRDFDAKDAGDIPDSSKFGRKFSNFWIKTETGVPLLDTQSGFRIYPVIPSLFNTIRSRFYNFEIEILVRFLWAGYSVKDVEIGVFYPPREQRVSHFKAVKDNYRLSLTHTCLVTLNVLRLVGVYRPFKKIKTHNNSQDERKGIAVIPFFLRFFGKKFCYFAMFFPLLYFYLTGKTARKSVLVFYKRLLSEKSAEVSVDFWQAFPNFWYFACSILDRFQMQNVEIDSNFSDGALFESGGIYAGFHYGDWLIPGATLASKNGSKVAIIIDGRFTPKFRSMMQKFDLKGLAIIDASQDGLALAIEIKTYIEQEYAVCFLGDRSEHINPEHICSRSFLGKQADFPIGPFKIAVMFKRPLFFFLCHRITRFSRVKYRAEKHQLWDGKTDVTPEELLTLYVKALEMQVRAAPEHWFNFYDFWRDTDAKI